VRPSRRPLRGLLRMKFFLNPIICLPHPEERSAGARLEGRTGAFAARAHATARQRREQRKISPYQSPFLVATPSLDLTFGGYCVLYPLESLVKDEPYRPPAGGVTIKTAFLMLSNPRFQTVARCPDVIRTIGTTKDVKIGTHVKLLPQKTALPAGPYHPQQSAAVCGSRLLFRIRRGLAASSSGSVAAISIPNPASPT
jgi:hypothetical protein